MIRLADISRRLVGRRYRLGECDCFSVVLDYLGQAGVAVPEEFRGQTRTSYPALYRSFPMGAKALMLELIGSLLEEIDPGRAVAGDVLLLQLAREDSGRLPFLAIDGGNGHVLAASDKIGVGVFPGRHYQRLRAWRCRQQSR